MMLLDRVAAEARVEKRSRARVAAAVAIVCLLAVAYLVFIRRYTSPYAAGSDASGYLNVARLLAHGELTQPVGSIAGLSPPGWDYYFQQPLGFIVHGDRGIMIPTYPVGLPLHLWLASAFVGLAYASILVNVVLAAAAGALMAGFGRRLGLSWGWALAGAAILWACPLYVFMGLQPMSDVPAMVWCLATIWCAVNARDHSPWAFPAGAALAMAVLVRPSNLLLVVPVAVVLGLHWRRWALLVLGGAPGAAFLAWYNLQLYGSILATGYGDVRSAFALEFFPHNAAHVGYWTVQLLSPVVVLGLLGVPWLMRQAPVAARLLLAWAGVFFVFYLFYYHTGETWWYLRFLLPAFPALIFLALLGARALAGKFPRSAGRKTGLLAALAIALVYQIRLGRDLHVTDIKHSDMMYLQLAGWMRSNAPANAIVMQMQTSGAFLFYTDFTVVRWDLSTAEAQRRLYAAAQAAGRPIYAALFDFEEQEAFAGRLAGAWTLQKRFGRAAIWQLAPDPVVIR